MMKSRNKNINKKAKIGEKSKNIPGPPKGERAIILRMGDRIGSVMRYNSTVKLPRVFGNHESRMRMNSRIYSRVKNSSTVLISVGIIGYLANAHEWSREISSFMSPETCTPSGAAMKMSLDMRLMDAPKA